MNIGDVVGVADLVVSVFIVFFGRKIALDTERAKQREERIRNLELKLREDRLQIYSKIIEPYILIMSKDERFYEAEKYKSIKARIRKLTKEEFANEIITSVEYREAGFRLALYGSDEVVRAFNRLIRFAQKNKNKTNNDKDGNAPESDNSLEMLEIMGELLLEIRRNVGNESTDLKYQEMFEGFISDIGSVVEKGEQVTRG